MANSQAISVQFKSDILTKTCNLNSDTIKAALYVTTASISGSTTAYSATNEVSGPNYSAGGVATTAGTVATSGTTAYWQPGANIVYTNVTLTTAFDTVLLYDTTNSNHAIGSWTFGAQTITAGTLTLTMPTNGSTTALIQLN
ncbi:MAG: hypothetical protein JO269_09625 [Burkholderiaceae bacterium]|nr:hypothetical protein [Burkholderiaceae bacterium]